jgi:methyl-accepting chemotaxis protein
VDKLVYSDYVPDWDCHIYTGDYVDDINATFIAAAAKEIKELISRSVERTNAGEETVRQTGKAINDVVSAVDRVSVIMSGITSSTTQQSFGIKQINQAVKHMDDVTQQNAALVEQAASSAQALAEQAKELSRAVSAFFSDGLNPSGGC